MCFRAQNCLFFINIVWDRAQNFFQKNYKQPHFRVEPRDAIKIPKMRLKVAMKLLRFLTILGSNVWKTSKNSKIWGSRDPKWSCLQTKCLTQTWALWFFKNAENDPEIFLTDSYWYAVKKAFLPWKCQKIFSKIQWISTKRICKSGLLKIPFSIIEYLPPELFKIGYLLTKGMTG